jgi:hypothetical protein
MVFVKEGALFVGRSFALLRSGLVLMHTAPKPLPSQIPDRCTKGSLREPFVQRAAAAPQLHKVLAALALRTTAVLQNSEKKSSLRSILFRNFAKPQRVVHHFAELKKTNVTV